MDGARKKLLTIEVVNDIINYNLFTTIRISAGRDKISVNLNPQFSLSVNGRPAPPLLFRLTAWFGQFKLEFQLSVFDKSMSSNYKLWLITIYWRNMHTVTVVKSNIQIKPTVFDWKCLCWKNC